MKSSLLCENVGSANPDIAGIGTLISFAVQAFISLVLFFWSTLLFTKWSQVASTDLPLFQETADSSIPPVTDGVTDLDQEDPGSSRPMQRLTNDLEATEKKLEILHRLFLYAIDVQTLYGIALMIAGLIVSKSLNLYHRHIIFDSVSLISVSNCAVIFNTAPVHSPFSAQNKRTYCYLSIFLFATLYFIFGVIFYLHMMHWDPSKPGQCYSPSGYTRLWTDQIYLLIIREFFYVALTLTLIYRWRRSRLWRNVARMLRTLLYGKTIAEARWKEPVDAWICECRWTVLTLAMIQFPLHLYSVVAMRRANEGLLEGGGEENRWGFGQVVAIIMLAGTLIECLKGVQEYWLWKLSSRPGRTESDISLPQVTFPRRGSQVSNCSHTVDTQANGPTNT
ncbi:hypothetical protein FQN55_007249 [Onygenales sp. PD_40]|nr:hypothetical protein FQN55_007249 [Onygenales sp. PD_40]